MTPDDQEARTEPAAAGAFGIGGALFVPAQQAADASTAAQSMDRAMPNVKALEKSSTAEQPADHPRPTHNPVSILVLESGSVQAKAAQPARSRVQRIGQLNTPATGTHGSNSKVRGSDRIGLGLSPPRTQARTPTPTKTHRGSRSAANTSSAEPVASPLASKTEALLRHAASQHELRGLLQNPPGLIQLTERTMLLAIKAYTQHPEGPFHIVQPLRCQALIGNESGPLQDWVQLIHEYHTEAAHILLSDPQSTSALRAAMATLLPQMTSTAPTPAEMVSKVLYLIFTGAQYVDAGSLGLKAVQRTVAAQACGARAVRDVRADSTAVVIPPPCKGISGTHVVHCKWLTISAYLDKAKSMRLRATLQSATWLISHISLKYCLVGLRHTPDLLQLQLTALQGVTFAKPNLNPVIALERWPMTKDTVSAFKQLPQWVGATLDLSRCKYWSLTESDYKRLGSLLPSTYTGLRLCKYASHGTLESLVAGIREGRKGKVFVRVKVHVPQAWSGAATFLLATKYARYVSFGYL